MATREIKLPPQGRRRGRYSDEFKARLIEASREPGMSTAAVALANGINANLLRRWITEAEGGEARASERLIEPLPPARVEAPFVRIDAPATPTGSESFRIEVRRGELSVVIDWPLSQVAQCVTLLGAVLR